MKVHFSLDRVFFRQVFFGFRTHVVATTVCTTGGAHTHTVARTFFCAQRAHCVLRTSSCVSHTCMAQGHEKGVCTCVVSLHLPFSLLMIHPSLLFLHGHFETNPDYDLTDSDIHMVFPYLHLHHEVWLLGQIRCKHNFVTTMTKTLYKTEY